MLSGRRDHLLRGRPGPGVGVVQLRAMGTRHEHPAVEQQGGFGVPNQRGAPVPRLSSRRGSRSRLRGRTPLRRCSRGSSRPRRRVSTSPSRTLPSRSNVALKPAWGLSMLPVADQVPVAGSYSSAEDGSDSAPLPPTTSTRPSRSRTAVWPERGVPIEPVAIQTRSDAGTLTRSALSPRETGEGRVGDQPPDIRGVIGGDDSTILDDRRPRIEGRIRIQACRASSRRLAAEDEARVRFRAWVEAVEDDAGDAAVRRVMGRRSTGMGEPSACLVVLAIPHGERQVVHPEAPVGDTVAIVIDDHAIRDHRWAGSTAGGGFATSVRRTSLVANWISRISTQGWTSDPPSPVDRCIGRSSTAARSRFRQARCGPARASPRPDSPRSTGSVAALRSAPLSWESDLARRRPEGWGWGTVAGVGLGWPTTGGWLRWIRNRAPST